MGVPPRKSRASTRMTLLPKSATPRAASSPAGPPPMTSTVSLGMCSSVLKDESPPTVAFSSFIRLCLLWQRYRFERYRRVDVVPGKIFFFTAPEFIHILLKFIPSRFPVDSDFFEERPVIGAV